MPKLYRDATTARHETPDVAELLAAPGMGVRRVTKWCKCEGYLEATAFDSRALGGEMR